VKLEVLHDADAVARRAAALIAAEARTAAAARGRFTLAASGGSTPWQMLRALANEDVPWDRVDVFQVDERVAPGGDPERNLTHLRESLLAHACLEEERLHAMPVEDADLEGAALRYAGEMAEVAGSPPVFDVIHLGLGADGHTASLVPGDPVLEVVDADVAVTARPYQGRRRMSVTYPLLERARRILWIVTGSAKREMLDRLRAADASIPAGRVRRDRAVVLADGAAAGAPLTESTP
jgi:6-phosphogluconolactonase